MTLSLSYSTQLAEQLPLLALVCVTSEPCVVKFCDCDEIVAMLALILFSIVAASSGCVWWTAAVSVSVLFIELPPLYLSLLIFLLHYILHHQCNGVFYSTNYT